MAAPPLATHHAKKRYQVICSSCQTTYHTDFHAIVSAANTTVVIVHTGPTLVLSRRECCVAQPACFVVSDLRRVQPSSLWAPHSFLTAYFLRRLPGSWRGGRRLGRRRSKARRRGRGPVVGSVIECGGSLVVAGACRKHKPQVWGMVCICISGDCWGGCFPWTTSPPTLRCC